VEAIILIKFSVGDWYQKFTGDIVLVHIDADVILTLCEVRVQLNLFASEIFFIVYCINKVQESVTCLNIMCLYCLLA
jgi:hypothetical protein